MPHHDPDRRAPPSASARESGWAFGAMVAAMALLAAVIAAAPLGGLFVRVSNDYGEGWNAYWALAAVRGLPLYSAAHVFTANNYPPLSFYLDGGLGLLIGDQIFAGRLVALAAMLAVALLIARILLRLGTPARWASVSALLFLLYNLVYFRQFVAVDNPQWLGQAIMLASVLPLLRAPPPGLGWRPLVASAALMVLAGLVKHNQFALPLAVAVWLLRSDRRALAIWAGAGVAFALLACALLDAAYGPAVFAEILGFKRTMSWSSFRGGLSKTLSLGALLLVGGLAVVRGKRRPHVALFAWFAGFGVVFGLVQRLGSGVYINAHFDALIGLVVVSGLWLGAGANGTLARPLRAADRSALLFVLLIPILIGAPKHLGLAIAEVRDRPIEAAVWRRTIAEARASRGPVLCEYLAVCYWAGRPNTLDFFAYGQKLRTGTDPRPLAGFVAARRAAMIVVQRDRHYARGDGRLPPPIPALIEANYVRAHAGPGRADVMVPRPAAVIAAPAR